MNLSFLLTGLVQGLILALVAYGVMIPFRLLDFPDLTAEGAYPLGGALCTCLLLAHVHPVLAIIIASFFTGLIGVATGVIHLKLRVNTLLSGIILSTMVYSVNLRILGKPNVALFDTYCILAGLSAQRQALLLCFMIALLILPLALFLRTGAGLKLLAVGFNPSFAVRQGVSIARYTGLGLFIAAAISGIAGALMVQLQFYMDVNMGFGIVIHGLAALMIGEAIVGHHTLARQLFAPLIGALIYQQIQGVILSLGLAPSDLKFFTGSLVLLVLAIQRKAQKEGVYEKA